MKAASDVVSRFTAYPRLHFGLLDLSDVSQRRYGGAGVLLGGPTLEVAATEAQEFTVSTDDKVDRQTLIEIRELASKLQTRFGNLTVEIRVKRLFPQHVGLGSKTSLLLGIIACLDRLKNWGLTQREMQELSGRGGTSGIGVHAFFEGGLLVDGGHPLTQEAFRPSSSATGHAVPPLITRFAIPTIWRFMLLLPAGIRRHAAGERDFFESATPVPDVESLKSIGACYHGIVPAVMLGDLRGFAAALDTLHDTGFKRQELEAQSAAVRRLYRALRDIPSVATGMSSLGPLLYVVHDARDKDAVAATERLASVERTTVLGSWPGRNIGTWHPA